MAAILTSAEKSAPKRNRQKSIIFVCNLAFRISNSNAPVTDDLRLEISFYLRKVAKMRLCPINQLYARNSRFRIFLKTSSVVIVFKIIIRTFHFAAF